MSRNPPISSCPELLYRFKISQDRTSLLNHASPPTNLNSWKSTSSSSRNIFCRIRKNSNSSRKFACILGKTANNISRRPFFTCAAITMDGEGTSSDSEELYVAREPELDEEYWAVAWLRGECHWEGRENERNAEELKRMFVDKEFDALKERCNAQLGNKCKCIMMVRKEEDSMGKEILVSRIVASLDFHTKYFSPGQTFHEERVVGPPPLGANAMDTRRASNSYGYISNVCVAKSLRRQGLASTMLHHAISNAKEQGIKKVFLRVYRENEGAMRLYEKMGFKKVDAANFDEFTSSTRPLLMCFEAST